MNLTKKPKTPRPKEVTEAQERHIKENPSCIFCGNSTVQAHHIIPYEFLVLAGRAEVAAWPEIFVSLCETEKGKPTNDCHLLWGHLEDFHSYNKDIVLDCQRYKQIMVNPKSLLYWQVKHAQRPRHISEMSYQDIQALKDMVNSLYPKKGGNI